MKKLAEEFLSLKRIAVAGVSRRETGSAANLIYRKLRGAGYEVYALNPRADEVEGDRCYPDLRALPARPESVAGGPAAVEGVVAVTPPAQTEELARQCAAAGVRRVWMHRSFGQGSVSEAAVAFCRQNGIEVIAGGCPMMYCQPADFGHKCLRWVLGVTGGLPK